MDKTSLKITKELLQTRSYERSYIWAQFLEKVSKAEDDEGFDMKDLEEVYTENDHENDCSDSEYMAKEEAEENEPIGICSQDVMSIIGNLTMSNARGILAQINDRANETGIIGTEVQKILEETLPIVEDYNRNWLEAGFERILKTFDLREIEEKVGTWMARNNSFVRQNFPLPFRERFHPYQLKKTQFVKELRGIDNETDSDSLHSDDTARYILSSRRHLGMNKRVATTTTTIKSYRLIEGKRDELRRKYAYVSPDDTMQMLKKTYSRPITLSYYAWQNYSNNCHRIDKKRIAPESHRIRRRRHRRSCNSSNTTFTSSDEEFTPRNRKFLKPLCCAREKYCSYEMPLPSRKIYFRNHDTSLDDIDESRPYLHESECACRGKDKLCHNVRHLANSSAEDWLVENCEDSVAYLSETEKVTSKAEMERITADNSNNKGNKKIQKTDKKVKKTTKEASKSKLPKGKGTTKTSAKSKEPPIEEINDDSFERQIQEAIKLSKEMYEKEIKNKNKSKSKSLKANEKQKRDNKTTGLKKKRKPHLDSSSSSTQSNESHTATKLASQFSSDLQLNDSMNKKKLLKHNLELPSKLELISLGSQNNTKNSTTRNRNGELTMDVGTSKPSSNSKIWSSQITKHEKASEGLSGKPLSNLLLKEQHNTHKTSKNKSVKFESHNKFEDKLSLKTKEINTPISISSSLSSSSETENIQQRIRKKMVTKKLPLMTINESKFEDSDALEIARKQTNNGSCQNPSISTYSFSENTTLFAKSGNIYNSTAMADNTAMCHQLLENNAYSSARSTIRSTQAKKEPTMNKARAVKTNAQHANNKINNSTVVSTAKSRIENQLPINDVVQENCVASTEINDCTITSSTSNSDLHQQTVVPNVIKKPGGRIVLYTPKDRSLAPENSFVNGRFKVTEDHLASIIGHKTASKFMKYYVGPREFSQSSTVYYKPPKPATDSDSSDSDIDFLDLCERYGILNESKERK